MSKKDEFFGLTEKRLKHKHTHYKIKYKQDMKKIDASTHHTYVSIYVQDDKKRTFNYNLDSSN